MLCEVLKAEPGDYSHPLPELAVNAPSRAFSSVMPHDTAAPLTHPQPTLADFCEWLPDGSRQPRYAPRWRQA